MCVFRQFTLCLSKSNFLKTLQRNICLYFYFNTYRRLNKGNRKKKNANNNLNKTSCKNQSLRRWSPIIGQFMVAIFSFIKCLDSFRRCAHAQKRVFFLCVEYLSSGTLLSPFQNPQCLFLSRHGLKIEIKWIFFSDAVTTEWLKVKLTNSKKKGG